MRKASRGSKKVRPWGARSNRFSWGIPVLLAFICLILYFNTLGHDLVFDDVTLILQNRSVLNLDWVTILYKGGYRPFRTFTYALNYAIGGENPFGYHLVNVLLHALNAVLAFFLFWRLSRSNIVAGVGAAVMALHPVQTAAVAYVSGRKDLLAAFFLLAGFLLYVSRRKEGGVSWRTQGMALILFCLAILSKEVAIVFPVLMICCDAALEWQRQSEESGTGNAFPVAVWRAFRQNIWFYSGFLALACFALYWAVFINVASRMEGYWGGSFETNLGTSFKLFTHYLRLSVFPHPLIADYSGGVFPISSGFSEPATLLACLLTIGFFVAVWFIFKMDGVAGFGLLWFAVTLAPVLQLIPFHEIAADHFLYLPMAGAALAFGSGFNRLHEMSRWGRIIWPILMIVLVAFSVRVVDRNRDWADKKTLWESTLSVAPHSYRANANLGQIYFQEGDVEKGFELTRLAAKLDSRQSLPLGNLGAMHYTQGQKARLAGRRQEALESLMKAQESLEAALELEPKEPFMLSNLGNVYKDLALVYAAESRPEEADEARVKAREYYLKALGTRDGRPALQAIWLNYGGLLIDAADYHDVPGILENYLKAFPEDPRGYYWIGYSYYRLGQPERARTYLEDALDVQFGIETASLLGYVYQELGQYQQGVEAFKKVLSVKPDSLEAQYMLGVLSLQLGETEQALKALGKASQLDRRGEYRERISSLISQAVDGAGKVRVIQGRVVE